MLTLNLNHSDDGLWAEFYFHVKQGHRSQLASVKPKGFQYPIYLRCGTSDIDNFHQIFMREEYSFIPLSPRTMIDLGGYIGLASLYIANKHPDCSVTLIEPDPDNFKIAALNCRQYDNIQCYNVGVWSSSCDLVISDKHLGDWGTTVRKMEIGETAPGRIKALSVEDIINLSRFNVIDFMKIDIEGSEKEIFEDSKSSVWIEKCKVISCELHDRFKPGCSEAFHAAVGHKFEHNSHGEYDYYVNKQHIQALTA